MDEVERIKKEKLEKMMGKTRSTVARKPVEVTEHNFNEFITEKKYAVIDCWAAWCMPCKIIAPSIEKIAEDYGDSVSVGKLDVDGNRKIAMKFGIMSIPTVLFFKDGRLVDNLIGAVPQHVLVEKLQHVMS
jgi:thioredoxin 1